MSQAKIELNPDKSIKWITAGNCVLATHNPELGFTNIDEKVYQEIKNNVKDKAKFR